VTRVAQRVSTRATMLKPRVNTSGHRLYPVTRLDPRRVNSRARGDDHGRIMSTEYLEGGTHLTAMVKPADEAALAEFAVASA
jgi:hypothetical protein